MARSAIVATAVAGVVAVAAGCSATSASVQSSEPQNGAAKNAAPSEARMCASPIDPNVTAPGCWGNVETLQFPNGGQLLTVTNLATVPCKLFLGNPPIHVLPGSSTWQVNTTLSPHESLQTVAGACEIEVALD